MKIHPLPVVIDLSPFIISDQKVSLLQLEKNDFTTFANLPEACQVLYHNVAGPNITLETEDFPFAAAIQRSVSTKGLWGYETLMKKAEEFGQRDEKGTYLRITLGTNHVRKLSTFSYVDSLFSNECDRAILRVSHTSLRFGREAITLLCTIMETPAQ